MADKHDKRKHLKAKASKAIQGPEGNLALIENEIKAAAGNAQQELGKQRASGNRSHRG
ncbi:MAG: hypothetical protein P4L33_07145 [Capsulimonadaceae bacterium]|nr:hypothetical protein [Capsulimonadaceae bacterium]